MLFYLGKVCVSVDNINGCKLYEKEDKCKEC